MSYIPNRILFIRSGWPAGVELGTVGVTAPLGRPLRDAVWCSSTRSRRERAVGVATPERSFVGVGVAGGWFGKPMEDLEGPGVEGRDDGPGDAIIACGSHIGSGGPPSLVSAALRVFSNNCLSAAVIRVRDVSASSPSRTPPYGSTGSSSSSSSSSSGGGGSGSSGGTLSRNTTPDPLSGSVSERSRFRPFVKAWALILIFGTTSAGVTSRDACREAAALGRPRAFGRGVAPPSLDSFAFPFRED